VEVLRVLKPGGHLVSFAAPRSYHRMCSGIEDAGFEIRDQIQWVFGSGFPKSHNLSGKFKGWGTALKPAYEPICLARKPLISTVANNVATHGTGAINIDDSRILSGTNTLGRWPANLIHDGSNEVRIVFPESNGQQGNLKKQNKTRQSPNGIFSGMRPALDHPKRIDTDKSASRFFYCAKASRNDRGENNKHPTVKPTDLMRYLCRLVTPNGGVVLDPFTGSGSTGKAAIIEGFKFIGIERESKSILTATERCELAARELHKVSLARPRYLLGELV
ncbi:MAG: site-specific DNA-methyltransferase, partial [Acinetobacter sp.]